MLAGCWQARRGRNKRTGTLTGEETHVAEGALDAEDPRLWKSGSPLRVTLPPEDILAMSRDTFEFVTCYWHPVGRSQGCC